jgi:hypothetical protein
MTKEQFNDLLRVVKQDTYLFHGEGPEGKEVMVTLNVAVRGETSLLVRNVDKSLELLEKTCRRTLHKEFYGSVFTQLCDLYKLLGVLPDSGPLLTRLSEIIEEVRP